MTSTFESSNHWKEFLSEEHSIPQSTGVTWRIIINRDEVIFVTLVGQIKFPEIMIVG